LTRFHLDTDSLVFALAGAGPERSRFLRLVESDADLGMSAVAWYELSRGPMTPEQLAVARTLFAEDGVVPFSEAIATIAADVFRRLGAVLLTRNTRDFAGIPELERVSELIRDSRPDQYLRGGPLG
jgi:predicted nucleic acid-binding protein